MNKQKLANNLKKTLYAGWLGGSLAVAFNADWTAWPFWVVMAPTVLLVSLFNDGPFEL